MLKHFKKAISKNIWNNWLKRIQKWLPNLPSTMKVNCLIWWMIQKSTSRNWNKRIQRWLKSCRSSMQRGRPKLKSCMRRILNCAKCPRKRCTSLKKVKVFSKRRRCLEIKWNHSMIVSRISRKKTRKCQRSPNKFKTITATNLIALTEIVAYLTMKFRRPRIVKWIKMMTTSNTLSIDEKNTLSSQ